MSYILPADPAAIETAVATNADAITANSTTLSLHGTRLTVTEDATTTNTANIATNTSDISTNTTNIATNTANIATNTANIATNTSNISTNTGNVSGNITDIATNTADIATINASIGVANGLATLDATGAIARSDLILHTDSTEMLRYYTPGGDQDTALLYTDPGFYLRGNMTSAANAWAIRLGADDNDATQVDVKPSDAYLGTTAPTFNLGKNATGERWDQIYTENAVTVASDLAGKERVRDNRKGLKFINKLQTRKWQKKNPRNKDAVMAVGRGLIAQEVESILQQVDGSDAESDDDQAFVVKTTTPDKQGGTRTEYGIRYTDFICPLIKAVQDLSAELVGIKARLVAVEKKPKKPKKTN